MGFSHNLLFTIYKVVSGKIYTLPNIYPFLYKSKLKFKLAPQMPLTIFLTATWLPTLGHC